MYIDRYMLLPRKSIQKLRREQPLPLKPRGRQLHPVVKFALKLWRLTEQSTLTLYDLRQEFPRATHRQLYYGVRLALKKGIVMPCLEQALTYDGKYEPKEWEFAPRPTLSYDDFEGSSVYFFREPDDKISRKGSTISFENRVNFLDFVTGPRPLTNEEQAAVFLRQIKPPTFRKNLRQHLRHPRLQIPDNHPHTSHTVSTLKLGASYRNSAYLSRVVSISVITPDRKATADFSGVSESDELVQKVLSPSLPLSHSPSPSLSLQTERGTPRTLVRGVPPLTQTKNKTKSETEEGGALEQNNPTQPEASESEPVKNEEDLVGEVPLAAPAAQAALRAAALIGACRPEPRSGETPEPPEESKPKRKTIWGIMGDDDVLRGNVSTEPVIAEDTRKPFDQLTAEEKEELLGEQRRHQKQREVLAQARATRRAKPASGAKEGEEITSHEVRSPYVKKSLTLAQYVGYNVRIYSRRERKRNERAKEAARLVGWRTLNSARDKGLLPPPIWKALPTLTVPFPKKLVPTMKLEGQVERLLRAYRGCIVKRFKKRPKQRFSGKQALGSGHYGELFREAIGALIQCDIAPCAWVGWIVNQWVELKHGGKYEGAKVPPLEWVFAAKTIVAMRHSFRESNTAAYELRWKGPIEAELLTLSMQIERSLACFESEEELVLYWRSSEVGQKWDALLQAAELEQHQQTIFWEQQIALGEWVSEWL